jgi:Methyltransferase domain
MLAQRPEMKQEHRQLIDKIAALPDDWHGAGSVSREVLLAIGRHCESMGRIRHSAETGAGRTTLLFSHLSDNHLVFAVDVERSITATRASSLLRAEHVTFIEGPTQKTLPTYGFDSTFQVVLIDGPHGYPFPDMEYYYFYPRLDPDALLVLDDTQIPSIGRMLDILRADPMFDLVEIVGNTAFLRRTSAPMIDPLSDSWWRQGYNRSYFEQITSPANETSFSRFLRLVSKLTPQVIKDSLPIDLKRELWKRM